MKRGLVFTLCALALAASATRASAQANIYMSLNLRYNDPADASEGGVWYLTAKTDAPGGIASVSVYLNNVDAVASQAAGQPLAAGQNAAFGAYTMTGTAAGMKNILNGGNPYFLTTGTGARNFLFGQDTVNAAGIQTGVGSGAGTQGNVANDPLKNTAFNNYAVLFSGTFSTASRPAFAATAPTGNVYNTLTPTPNSAASITPAVFPADTVANPNFRVRGDSLGSLNLNSVAGAGLRGGDANRDGIVNGFDFAILSGNFDPPNSTGTKTWDQGNFNDDAQQGRTNGFDFAILSGNFSPPNGPGVPPSVTAVPEPASAALLGIALMGIAFRARRR